MDRQSGGWTDGLVGGRTIGWVGGWMGWWVDGWVGGWTDSWVGGWMGWWVDGQSGGWMGGWAAGRTPQLSPSGAPMSHTVVAGQGGAVLLKLGYFYFPGYWGFHVTELGGGPYSWKQLWGPSGIRRVRGTAAS